MDKPRPCGCKGRRSCLICEEQFNIRPQALLTNENLYEYCHNCGQAWESSHGKAHSQHPQHEGSRIMFPGVYIQHDFLSEDEKNLLIKGINQEPWSLSQSGRRKQNYGPRCNFKKTKIQIKDFHGFPKYSQFVQEKFKNVTLLSDFQTIEQCTLEYDPKRGASIDPHIDDCWIWGERIVTVNVMGNTFLTMTKYKGDSKRYNIHYLDKSDLSFQNGDHKNETCDSEFDNIDVKVRIYMPERSLIVLYGSARYNWEHFIPREDIKDYRLCIAYREFTPPYVNGKFKEIGDSIREIAKQFW